MRSSLITLLALALLIAGHSAARAAELTATDAKVSEKKITLSFSVSEMPEIDKVFDYGANIVKIKVPGLNFGSAQLKGDKLKVSDEHGESFYRFTRFSKIEGGGMISIYLGKLCSPADALVVPRDGRIEVEIIKPLWKLGSSPADSPAADNPPADDPPANDNPPANNTTEPVQATPATDQGGDTQAQPVSNNSSAQDTPVRPAFDNSGAQSYRKFDLDKVPAAKVELKGMPFDEAILRIVADSGFNVVVGNGIDDTEVNLNFTQKGLSLKAALDILCMAYDLKYDVTDDAIVISRR
ncbi:MAG: hypothetical protein H7A35_02640 [Planctomycetales bacterium]|nr:hypothetical protein [bacterium]UNM08957.1 MAG: hypothetical protein H7A35_02640 [Planctomycetales bacterium]